MLPLAARRSDAVLNFVHIPKTGGSSLECCLAVFCASNRLPCLHTFHHSRVPGSWLGQRTSAANNLEQLRARNQSARDALEIVPHDEMASYLCYGSDFRKGEIVPPQARPPHDERYYAQRRVPDADELLRCLRNYVLLSAIEVDGQFAAERGGRAAALALPQRRSAVCVRRASQREPLGAEKPRAHEPQRRDPDALALNQLD